ncbi:MAG TPA: DoxX family protein [Polyangiaceae bacterium]|jgi:putative oxidoreductase
MTTQSIHIHGMNDETSTAHATRFLVPLGRLLFVLIFLESVPMHFSAAGANYAAAQGVPFASVLVPLSGLLALVGGLSVLLGVYARWGALLLALFLVPVTFAMHRFWMISDPAQAMLQRIMFMKNITMLGGTFLLMHFGAGPISVDQTRARV